MSASSTQGMRVLAGIAAAIIIAAAGVAGGYYAFRTGWSLPASPPLQDRDAAASPVQAEEQHRPNVTTYDASPPSRGSVLRTVGLNVRRQENGRFLGGMIPMSQAGEIAQGQRALLYGPDGALADIGATVSSIAPEKAGGDYASVILIADEEPSPQRAGDDSNLNNAERAEIILQRETGAQRLPLSAIVRKNGEPYLWEVLKMDNGTRKAYLKRTNLLMSSAGMVVVHMPASVSNVFILNPDGELRDGDTVNIRDTYYEGPMQTDDQKLEEAMRFRTPQYIVDTYKGPDIEFTCSSDIDDPSPANAVDAFIAQVRALAAQQKTRQAAALPVDLPRAEEDVSTAGQTEDTLSAGLPPAAESASVPSEQPQDGVSGISSFGTAPAAQ